MLDAPVLPESTGIGPIAQHVPPVLHRTTQRYRTAPHLVGADLWPVFSAASGTWNPPVRPHRLQACSWMRPASEIRP